MVFSIILTDRVPCVESSIFFGQCQHFAQFVDWSKITRYFPKQVSFLTMGLCVEHPPRMISHECFCLVCYQQFPILRRFFWFRNLRHLPRKWLSFSREWEIQVENGTAVRIGKKTAIGIRIFFTNLNVARFFGSKGIMGKFFPKMAGRNSWGLGEKRQKSNLSRPHPQYQHQLLVG